jgi:hypothetical protein
MCLRLRPMPMMRMEAACAAATVPAAIFRNGAASSFSAKQINDDIDQIIVFLPLILALHSHNSVCKASNHRVNLFNWF